MYCSMGVSKNNHKLKKKFWSNFTPPRKIFDSIRKRVSFHFQKGATHEIRGTRGPTIHNQKFPHFFPPKKIFPKFCSIRRGAPKGCLGTKMFNIKCFSFPRYIEFYKNPISAPPMGPRPKILASSFSSFPGASFHVSQDGLAPKLNDFIIFPNLPPLKRGPRKLYIHIRLRLIFAHLLIYHVMG